jgi:hypothetical protein
MVHFPVALWTVAAGIIAFRACSDGAAARAFDRVLVPLLAVGVATGAIAYILGWLVWPTDALQATPLGRNHIIGATGSLFFWTAALFLRWHSGQHAWADRLNRSIMLGLGALGAGLLALTGTLGGHLHGAPAKLSDLLRLVGLDVYQTFYVPDWVLAVVGAVVLAMPALAIFATRVRATRRELEGIAR